jgi:hypothetical protein
MDPDRSAHRARRRRRATTRRIGGLVAVALTASIVAASGAGADVSSCGQYSYDQQGGSAYTDERGATAIATEALNWATMGDDWACYIKGTLWAAGRGEYRIGIMAPEGTGFQAQLDALFVSLPYSSPHNGPDYYSEAQATLLVWLANGWAWRLVLTPQPGQQVWGLD